MVVLLSLVAGAVLAMVGFSKAREEANKASDAQLRAERSADQARLAERDLAEKVNVLERPNETGIGQAKPAVERTPAPTSGSGKSRWWQLRQRRHP